MTEIIPRRHDKNMPMDELIKLVDESDWDAKAIYAAKLVWGDGIESDPQAGIAILQEAHAAGSVRATAELGFRHVDADGPVPQDLEQAEAYAALAIERGNRFGWLVRLNIAHARQDTNAAFEHGKMFLSQTPPEERNPDIVYEVGGAAHFAGRYAEAIPFYEEAASAGHSAAAINLSLMIQRGQVELPNAEIITLLRSASIVPAGAALFAQCVFYADRHGEEVDPELQIEAVNSLKAIQYQYHSTYEMLGDAYENGFGVEKDPSAATYYYKEGAECEDADPQGPVTSSPGWVNVVYALRLAEGKGCDVNLPAAFDALERAGEIAQEAGSIGTLAEAAHHASRLAELADQPDLRKRALPLLEKGAQGGHPEVMLALAKALLRQTGKVGDARPWFVRAIACDDVVSAVDAANCMLAVDCKAEAYAFARVAADMGADLSPDLAGLDPAARDKGLLFMKGKSGQKLYGELKVAIAELVEQFGPPVD